MTKKNVAEWVSIILCLLPSPMVIMFLLILVGIMSDTWGISTFLAVVICVVAGFIVLYCTAWLLKHLIYFIIK